MLANIGNDWVEGENFGDPLIDQNSNLKAGSNKETTTDAMESGKKTFAKREFRGNEKGKQTVNEGGKSNKKLVQSSSVLREISKSNSQMKPKMILLVLQNRPNKK